MFIQEDRSIAYKTDFELLVAKERREELDLIYFPRSKVLAFGFLLSGKTIFVSNG